MAKDKSDAYTRIRAEIEVAEQIGVEVDVNKLATKYEVSPHVVRALVRKEEIKEEEQAVFTLVNTPKELIKETAQAIQAKKPDKPIEEIKGEIDFVMKSTENLQKLRVKVQDVALLALDKLSEALDSEENQTPRDLKFITDAVMNIQSSFFKDTSTKITINNNNLAQFRENLTL